MGLAGETAEGLWLLVQTELRMGNSQATLKNGTKLKTLFPDSDEVVKYKGLLK
jgi:Tfp pilus assembly protein PilF